MAFWCYILCCADGRFYTGRTDSLERRIGQHQANGYCTSTAQRRPVTLAWMQEFPSRLEALEAERRMSPWSRKKKQALFAGNWPALPYWAKPPAARPSTSLGTNAAGGALPTITPDMASFPSTPLVPSEIETLPKQTTPPCR